MDMDIHCEGSVPTRVLVLSLLSEIFRLSCSGVILYSPPQGSSASLMPYSIKSFRSSHLPYIIQFVNPQAVAMASKSIRNGFPWPFSTLPIALVTK